MTYRVPVSSLALAIFFFFSPTAPLPAGTLRGQVQDRNWYAQYGDAPTGVGYYEYAVNANGLDVAAAGGFDDTDVFGVFQMNNLTPGRYTVASWDVWWRSAFAFDVPVLEGRAITETELRLSATMWGYPAFWNDQGHYEHGQTFVASGPVTMIYLRNPVQGVAYRLTVHEDGPGGPQLGVTRSFSTRGDHRLIYGYGELPTVAGRTYYVRVRTSSPAVEGVLRRMDPRPDYSDPMPGGCLWVGGSSGVEPVPDEDLGLIIMSDDDGLLTNLFTRRSGGDFSNVTSIGQSFIARGTSLVSTAFWLADPSAPLYAVAVYDDSPGGPQIGTTKQGKPARLTGDPEMLVTWAPAECPLVPGQEYYIEITKSDGGVFHVAYANNTNPYPYGTAYRNRAPVSDWDLAGTLMEEEYPGSATKPAIAFVSYPEVVESDREANALTVTWTTDVPGDSCVEYALRHPPYTMQVHQTEMTTDHSVPIPHLPPHALIHYRASSQRSGYRIARARDQVVTTHPSVENLLANPGFEEGSGGSPRSVIPGWSQQGGLDIKASDGSWFAEVPPYSGNWLLQGAVNGGSADAVVYQRVAGVSGGQDYTFSAWVSSWMIENGQFKYDVWNDPGRLSYLQLGIDPTGGSDPDSATIVWSPRLYSHLHYSNASVTANARRSPLTVFVRMRGSGGEWHLFGLDNCVLTPDEVPIPSLRVDRQGRSLTLSWLHPDWKLQSAIDLKGSWTTDPEIGSPYQLEATDVAKFFRLQP